MAFLYLSIANNDTVTGERWAAIEVSPFQNLTQLTHWCYLLAHSHSTKPHHTEATTPQRSLSDESNFYPTRTNRSAAHYQKLGLVKVTILDGGVSRVEPRKPKEGNGILS